MTPEAAGVEGLFRLLAAWSEPESFVNTPEESEKGVQHEEVSHLHDLIPVSTDA